MLAAHDGGGGGRPYDGSTQREIMATIGSIDTVAIDRAETLWRDTAARLRDINELVDQRLKALTGEGGWTGTGASAFRAVVQHDVVDTTRDFAKLSEANANALAPVNARIGQSTGTAMVTDIPWDNETQWRVDREKQDQSFWGKVDEVVTGDDDGLEEREKNADYLVLDGGNGERARRTRPDWESLVASTPAVTPPDVFRTTETPVSEHTHRFDRLMERMSLNSDQHERVRSSAADVNTALSGFTPAVADPIRFTSNDVTGPGGQQPTTPAPFQPGSTPESGTRTPGAPTNPGVPNPTGPGTPSIPPSSSTPGLPNPGPGHQPLPSIPGPESGLPSEPGTPGLGDPGTSLPPQGPGASAPTPGQFPGPDTGDPRHLPGWERDHSKLPVEDPGTSAAGLDPVSGGRAPVATPGLTQPAAPQPLQGPGNPLGPGGVGTTAGPGALARPGLGATPGSPVTRAGGPGQAGGPGGGAGMRGGGASRPGLITPGASSKAGHGSLGARGAGAPSAGQSGASFRMGPNGKGIVNPGNVGAMAGVPAGGARGNQKAEEKSSQGHQTWLEEDKDVWSYSDGRFSGDI